MVLYVAGFRQYIYTEDDEAQFNALLEETRSQDTQAGAR
jgi:hypothetical protein